MNVLDIFSGAGGLSEGFRREGFNILAHVEMDIAACYTLKTREAYYYLKDNNIEIYNNYLKGKISRDELYSNVPNKNLDKVINKAIDINTLDSLFSRIANSNTPSNILFKELSSFILKSKKILANKVREGCSYDKITIILEQEWNNYFDILKNKQSRYYSFDNLLIPVSKILQKKNGNFLFNNVSYSMDTGFVSLLKSNKYKILFLPGQGTNARLAKILLQKTGWFNESRFDFVIPDPPFTMDAFTNDEQLEKIGLDSLIEEGIYNKNYKYKEWGAGFERLFEEYELDSEFENTKEESNKWLIILKYLKNIIKKNGPFDGIMGFCEGVSVASVALNLEQQGYDFGLKKSKFLIAIAPWQSPYFVKEGLFDLNFPLKIPTLQIVGENDMDVFLNSSKKFSNNFSNIDYYTHSGQHVYPVLTNTLKEKIEIILNKGED